MKMKMIERMKMIEMMKMHLVGRGQTGGTLPNPLLRIEII